jgi:chemotaxis response regulator CheB
MTTEMTSKYIYDNANKIVKNDSNLKEIMNGIVNENTVSNEIVSLDEQVLICTDRLQKLEILEKQLPEMIEAAIQEHKKNKLRMLHEKDKENPAAVNLRVKRYNERHRDEINARRREKRKLEKEKKEAQIPKTGNVLESFTVNKTRIHKILTNTNTNTNTVLFNQSNETTHNENGSHTPPSSPTLNEVLTVRFDI